jgi:hypothetical protein
MQIVETLPLNTAIYHSSRATLQPNLRSVQRVPDEPNIDPLAQPRLVIWVFREVSQKAAELEEMGRSNNLRGAASLLSLFEADISDLIRSIRSAMAALEPHVALVDPSGVEQ